MSQLIKNWAELAAIPNESATHILEVNVDRGSGYLTAKNEQSYNPDEEYFKQLPHLDVYLTTHTFYESKYKFSSSILQACGFDVELENWDAKHY